MGPTGQDQSQVEGARPELLLLVWSAGSKWRGSGAAAAPGALLARVELLPLDFGGSRPSQAHLAGTVWHWAPWSSPAGLSVASTEGQGSFS